MNPDYIIGSRNPHILFADWQDSKNNVAAKDIAPAPTDETEKLSDAGGATGSSHGATPPGEHELTFDDILDIVNPLQHIPIVNYIYRAITGDKISGFAEVAGGGLFGGPLGLVGGVLSAMFNDETGHSPAETMVADILGIEDHATMVAQADRTPKPIPEDLDTQLAEAMPPPQTLETQIASATLPPVAPAPVNAAPAAAPAKLPYGGMMDMAAVERAKQGPTADLSPGTEVAANEEAPLAAAVPTPAADLPEGQKFYPLAKAKRMGTGTRIAMPLNPGPDVRLKPISRMAVSHPPVTPKTAAVIAIDPEAEAHKILGLPEALPPVADNEDVPSGPSPLQADLLPGHGVSQGLPPQLIEDMMKMGLQKYQQGLQNGTLSATPAIDVRG